MNELSLEKIYLDGELVNFDYATVYIYTRGLTKTWKVEILEPDQILPLSNKTIRFLGIDRAGKSYEGETIMTFEDGFSGSSMTLSGTGPLEQKGVIRSNAIESHCPNCGNPIYKDERALTGFCEDCSKDL